MDLTQEEDNPHKHSPDIISMPTHLTFPDCEKENQAVDVCETSSDISISPVDLEYPAVGNVLETEVKADAFMVTTGKISEVDKRETNHGDSGTEESTLRDGDVLGDLKPSMPAPRGKRGRPMKAKGEQNSAPSAVAESQKSENGRGRKRKKVIPADAGEADDKPKTVPKDPKSNSKDVFDPIILPEVQAQIEIKSKMIAGWVNDLR